MISVSASGFGGGLVAGDIISPGQFVVCSAATNANHRFVYRGTTRAVLFARNGRVATAAVQFATLPTGPYFRGYFRGLIPSYQLATDTSELKNAKECINTHR